MEKYGSGLGKVLEENRKLAADDKAIKAAQDLQEKWATLQQTAVSLANTVMSTLGPQIEKILTQMTDWVEKTAIGSIPRLLKASRILLTILAKSTGRRLAKACQISSPVRTTS